jgi:hypothetical protein
MIRTLHRSALFESAQVIKKTSSAGRNLGSSSNPHLLQLRALQAFADSGGNTLVLGLPNGSLPLVNRGEKVPQRKEPKAED